MIKTQSDRFREYYYGNKGTKYKSFEFRINNSHQEYDIYWGDPNVIFDEKTRMNGSPLAVRIMPTRLNAPNPRIFIHEKLTQEHNDIFELVVAHEIGHLWLDDVVGLSRPTAEFYINNQQAEIWADYFAYSFFKKYRSMESLEEFGYVLKEAGNLQSQLYNSDPDRIEQATNERIADLHELEKGIEKDLKDNNQIIIMIRISI